MIWRLETIGSPIGDVHLIAAGDALCVLEFEDHESRMYALLERRHGEFDIQKGAVPDAMRRRVKAYFEGDLGRIEDISTMTGGTAFQEKVWALLRHIPVGETTTYGAIAQRIGSPGASRAVGMANGSNPVAVVIPCHRVIGADGALTGYGGGLMRKKWLLAHEGAAIPSDQGELEL